MSFNDRYYRPRMFGGFSFFPPVIKYLMIINGIVFLIQVFIGQFYFTDDFGRAISFEDYLIKYFALMPLGEGFKPWQLITFQFMHGSFSHILFNMLYMWMFGTELENLWGSKKFLIYYLTCGIGAGLTQLFLAPIFEHSVGPTVGASGGIYGLLMAFAIYFPRRPIYLYFFIPIPAMYLIGFMILLEFFSVGDLSLTAHLAHIGGALIGLIYILVEKNFNWSLDSAIDKLFYGRSFKSYSSYKSKYQDVEYYEIEEEQKSTDDFDQEEIDRILDKISKYGYQSLTEKEKRTLFEASKKL
ncbi:MAG: rhomboid family intramembrane serine protease [Ignavibacteria bacterium]|nr:rhomboid family intramembrane serine protease [Ignavibacteria bacterium]